MSTNVSAWAIRRPIPSLVLFLVLMTLGLISFFSLGVTRFPNIDIPIVTVTITQSGAAPVELESQVTKRVEDTVASVTGVKHVTSSITDGSSVTTIEFQLGTDTDRAVNDVKDAVSKVRQDLPRTINEPITQRLDIEGLPIVTYAASAPSMTLEELSWFIDDTAARRLQGVRGVAQVSRVGGVKREIRVSLDPDRLIALGISAGEVNVQLHATNTDLAGGRGWLGGAEQSIRALASATTVERLAATSVTLPGGRKVRLDQLGTVSDATEERRTFASLNGRDVVAFTIVRAKGESDIVVAARVAEALDKLAAAHPEVTFEKIDSTIEFTLGNYESAMHTLLEGAALAVLVVFLFLRDLRATIIAAIALPLSVFPTFWAMEMLGFSLNMVSLLAITLVTGILVDDAIVEIENIVRHIRMGKSPYRAALEAADEIGLAVIAITLTIVAVFAPVSFMGGIAGQYFSQFGLTVAAAVLFSLLVARLLTPMIAAYFLRPKAHVEPRDGFVMRAYTRVIGWTVRHYYRTLMLGFVVFAASIASVSLLPSGFLPAEDSSRSIFAIELPPGSRLGDTEIITSKAEAIIKRRPEVVSVFIDGGRILGATGGSAEVRKATITVQYTPRSERSITQRELEQLISAELKEIPDVRSWVMAENGQRSFTIEVTGTDNDKVSDTAARLTSEMHAVPWLANAVNGAALDRPEILIIPRPVIAAELGVSTEALSEVVRIATLGDVDQNLAKFNAPNRQVPIRVQLDEQARTNLQLLQNLKVKTAHGDTVPLITVAEVKLGKGPSSIERYDRLRRVTIGADLVGTDALGQALAAVYQLPAARALPSGVILRESGDVEVMTETFSSFGYAMGAGVMMVFSVLVILFGSFLQPVAILLSLPLCIGGAIFALLLTDRPISLPVFIGFLMLMGIVTKNAIMLVDFAIVELRRGVPRGVAIIDAGRKRARPIVMTTIAMAGGMFPSALAFGAGGEFRSPMAIAVIGGLLVSTLLSLLFVPAFFMVMDDASRLFLRLFGWLAGPRDEPGDAEPHRQPAAAPALAAGKPLVPSE
ncbi:efflux RND transporter permease subunit [Rhodomicrobium lacus]|uniref:efflux RND transporter permease subunit n=1 Tax=Rhodomicrobium lacus TaxID=2498452 RepID=UPI0026E17384|nr:efflux RND transporter permease subunit [Rhodomicrobium lacus]WKW50382.1 efflux RND transporter permease subunit [Rhodomicrobium lacus]